MRPTAQEGTTVTTTLRAAGPRTLSAILAASAIALACVACSPGGSGATPGDTSPTTSSDAASAPADDGASDQGDQGTTTDQGGSADQGSSAGASKEALCNDLEGADLNGDSDEDTENGVAIWNQMVGHAPATSRVLCRPCPTGSTRLSPATRAWPRATPGGRLSSRSRSGRSRTARVEAFAPLLRARPAAPNRLVGL
jgi:hypothetical protein